MDISELIDLAKAKTGSYGAIANAIGKPQARISDMKRGERKANASEVAAMALIAGLPVFETIADIECQQHPDLAGVWKRLQESRVNR